MVHSCSRTIQHAHYTYRSLTKAEPARSALAYSAYGSSRPRRKQLMWSPVPPQHTRCHWRPLPHPRLPPPPGPRVRGVSFSARDHTKCRFPTLFRSISQSWSAGLRRISSVTGVKALSCALRPPLPTMSQRITPLNRIRELFIRWPAFIAVMEANGGASKRPECVSQEPPAWGQEVTRTLTYPLVQQHWLPNDPWSTCTNTT